MTDRPLMTPAEVAAFLRDAGHDETTPTPLSAALYSLALFVEWVGEEQCYPNMWVADDQGVWRRLDDQGNWRQADTRNRWRRAWDEFRR